MSPDERPWIVKLLIILLGYASVVVPAILLICVVRRKYATSEPRTVFGRFLRSFAIGNENYQLLEATTGKQQSPSETRNLMKDAIMLMFFFSGIQVDQFGDAQFLVFCNRVVAMVVCAIVLMLTWRRQPPHAQPLYVHSYTSISNTMSTWCQYEALKYVSFPTQTICKTSKVVVTMLMGLVLRGQRYSWQEWGCGGAVGLGASLFLLSSGRSRAEGVVTSISGMFLMIGYLLFDSYTLNYQKKLFDKKPKISKYQMMMGVNVFSAILCAVSLIEQGTLFSSIDFALHHENFARDVFFLSLSGATGQLFIYSTIEKFGPIVFAVMMTIRQMDELLVNGGRIGCS
ncbi:adenosine 3'-phospho 5'-phosphosulfate transporter 1 domain protein [Ancylostoma duodenale]|uniref:Adenosine 3'-phospho 5'-phosphosulfate transporter 1 n=1 Tax=Ancylostoma duodenale TaxID=51022 RepID=A0A0C2H338_9BILA|nr:adenosine 3'-phospho 5'-phosphosulfate transporter 1 domain protein [Ancylostoma duodenale]